MAANSPILISKSTTGIANGVAPFLPEGLTNTLKQGAWVDEIRFTSTTRRVDEGTWYGGVPDALRVAIRLGNTELTKGLIPAALLCRPRDWAGEGAGVVNNYIWRLPKPLYLPENGNLAIQVQQREDFRTATPLLLDVDVALVARPTRERPQLINVPFAAHYQGSLVTAGTVLDRSGENDLRNPFRQVLRVTRFSMTSWGVLNVAGYDPTTARNIQIIGGATSDNPGACGANTVQLVDQMGDFGVRDATPPGAFAAFSDRAWKVDAQLKPNSYYIADLSTTLSTGYSSTRQAIGMIGYRTIPISDLGVAR